MSEKILYNCNKIYLLQIYDLVLKIICSYKIIIFLKKYYIKKLKQIKMP